MPSDPSLLTIRTCQTSELSSAAAALVRQQQESTHLSCQYPVEDSATPGQFDYEPVFPGIDLSESVVSAIPARLMNRLNETNKRRAAGIGIGSPAIAQHALKKAKAEAAAAAAKKRRTLEARKVLLSSENKKTSPPKHP
ncbi:hypothetical protein KCU65_g7921, partial [Aureobasidium melanogenum]